MNIRTNHPQQLDNLTSSTGAFAGTNISKGDESNNRLLDRDESVNKDEDIVMGTDADITPEDLAVLEDTEYMPTTDEDNLRMSALDNTDEDGDPLNESKDFTGNDLDVPGSEDDDLNEGMGEEDEENNSYSLGGDAHDD